MGIVVFGRNRVTMYFFHPNEIGRAPVLHRQKKKRTPPSMCVYFLSRVFTLKHNIRCASKSNHYWRVYKNRLIQSTRCVPCSLARNNLHLHARQLLLSIHSFVVQIEQRSTLTRSTLPIRAGGERCLFNERKRGPSNPTVCFRHR